jgi:putative addiction module CopG family antidote
LLGGTLLPLLLSIEAGQGGVVMTIQLSPEAEELLQRIVAYGDGQSADEVIAEALQLLEEQRRYERLKTAVGNGFASLDRGEGAAFTPELRAQMKQNALRKAQDASWKPNPDVCP